MRVTTRALMPVPRYGVQGIMRAGAPTVSDPSLIHGWTHFKRERLEDTDEGLKTFEYLVLDESNLDRKFSVMGLVNTGNKCFTYKVHDALGGYNFKTNKKAAEAWIRKHFLGQSAEEQAARAAQAAKLPRNDYGGAFDGDAELEGWVLDEVPPDVMAQLQERAHQLEAVVDGGMGYAAIEQEAHALQWLERATGPEVRTHAVLPMTPNA